MYEKSVWKDKVVKIKWNHLRGCLIFRTGLKILTRLEFPRNECSFKFNNLIDKKTDNISTPFLQ